jgi:hypothetical protein
MPSKTAKQARFMRAVAKSPKFAKKVGVPTSVGKEYSEADKKMRKYNKGGVPKESTTGPSTTKPVSSGAAKSRAAFEAAMAKRNAAAKAEANKQGRFNPDAQAGKGNEMKKKYAKGGSVSARADGVAKKGRTNTKHVKMAKGGSCGMKKGK